MKSTNQCLVVPIELHKHPNADSLSIVNVFGYVLCVNTEAWQNVKQAVHIPPDSIVDGDRPEFAYLGPGKHHIKVKKLRGIISQGILIPLPFPAKNGTDLSSQLGVEHYEESIEPTGGVTPPKVAQFKYDVDTLRKYAYLFQENEIVVVTEKIHGQNCRFVYQEDFWVGGRNLWFKHDNNTPYSKSVTSQIELFCREYPGVTLWGEVAGTQKLKYGFNRPTFLAFDIYDGFFKDYDEFKKMMNFYQIPTVPEIGKIEFNVSKIEELAEGQSLIASHVREGVVIRPLKERFTNEIGRLQLKLVGNGYYLGK